MIPPPDEKRSFYSVAVYWLREGEYGGARPGKTYDDCLHIVGSLERSGYGKKGVSEIHIIQTTKRVWKFQKQGVHHQSMKLSELIARGVEDTNIK